MLLIVHTLHRIISVSMASEDRQYELILFGATGYTGKLTAEHITKNLPTDLRWAVAGRSADKLEALVKEIQPLNSDRVQPGVSLYSILESWICRWT